MVWKRFTRIPVIADNIARDRFFQIRSNLKVINDNDVSDDSKKSDKFWKVRPLLSKIWERCLQQERPRIVSIDEQIIPFHGQISMRQYVKGKPNPVGLKVFVMCTTYGLPLDFIFYEGKGTDVQSPEDTSDLDLGGKIALKLSDSLQPWSSIYVDRYLTSELLFDILLNREVFATGTLMKNKVPKLTELQTDRDMKRNGRGSVDQIVRNDKKMLFSQMV
ncbi:hypothetical protein AVEN_34382-1 [Araneus ventricosus]|uniref:PiggyBac transposable element-derived protein domain-containing protein n=1 Tax=Araneus ventricosus TaxID=182803 RepID=A0A4Y2G5K8_ARAVE|nr:hypothetical protein AVEN_34382-1 [Araneus ventricosus]